MAPNRKRAKSTDVLNNSTVDGGVPRKKLARTAFHQPTPQRPQVKGRVLTCGQGDAGQLGLGDDEFERKRPALVPSIEGAVNVQAGGMHNLVLTEDGRVISFGCNDEGALGRDTSVEGSEFKPAEVTLPAPAVRISAGDSHSACLLEDGRVFAWGSFRDSHGSMGLTLQGNKRLPVEIMEGKKCNDIASGTDHLVILTCAGKVYSVGCAEQGQLGRVSERSISGEGRRGKTDLLRPSEVFIKRCKPIEAIWATNYCTFLRESQTNLIWAYGLNNFRQLGFANDHNIILNPISTGLKNVQQIAGGQQHTLILKDDGKVFVIGRHDYGRLGLGNIKEDIKVLQEVKELSNKKIVFITSGEIHSFAVTETGHLYAWGMGSSHQLGTGLDEDALEPTLIKSKQTENKKIISAGGGGQHSIFLVLE